MDSSSYMDFGSDSDTADEGEDLACTMDSDEEDRNENDTLMKMMMTTMPHAKTKQCRDVDEFAAEMEAELDKRALVIESLGGVEHQRSISRSSSSSSLHKMSQSPLPSSSKSQKADLNTKPKKTVKFDLEPEKRSKTKSSPEPRPPGEGEPTTGSSGSGSEKPELYDSIYFDSDESEGDDDAVKTQKQKKRELLSNDDLFYDPESDARDQAWIDRKRQKYRAKQNQGATQETEPSPSSSGSASAKNRSKPCKPPAPSSDAVLNCPACFTTLCIDCQRHEFYSSQYRAMFVMNCVIDKSETLRVPVKEEKKGRKNRNRHLDDLGEEPKLNSDLFNPVKCKVCATQIAVYDSDEVYHFFNVLASYA